MSESETPTATDSTAKHESHGRKRLRHRKKLLYDKILKQMEFYFSDANLTKDRFLGELVKTDPYVPIEVFLKFNKIRAMTQDVIDIAKAMKFSTILELSEDRQKIRRKKPVEPYDAESRTVYVESIPVTANREWLEKVFSDYGHVAYISLPKFKNSQRIKGYAFIEFDKAEDAHNCIVAFTQMGCRLPTSMPPEELSSVKMFSVEESDDKLKQEDIKKDKTNKTTEESGIKTVEDKVKEDTDIVKDDIKVKEDLKVKEEDEPPRKKSRKSKDKRPKNLELRPGQDSDSEKRDTPTDECKNITTPVDDVCKKEESKNDLTSHNKSKDDADSPSKKKNKKKSAKTKIKTPNGLNTKEAPKGALWGLQVLPRSEWKALRNKYLTLQRNYMKQVKFNLYNRKNSYSAIPEPATLPMEADTASNPGKMISSKNVTPLEKIPGVFVREVLPEPCCDIRHTKRTVRSNIHALHVDAKEGQSEIIIRFDSAKAADEYCANSSNRASILSGVEEEEQWARAEAGRAWPRPRGRERLRARLQRHGAAPPPPPPPEPASPQPTHTHIRFDE
ncbi:la-related protein 7 [Leguminivora glycinivorella]|uniref:la-related protein 7 n=1 Tax=Leguminivora glycinivorella TaxID=1035111 RepID=UPI00200E5545|nr:la-related protein 7 [Leguminivora glycinivorella]